MGKKKYKKINPSLHWAIIVFVGPKKDLEGIIDSEIENMFEKILTFEIPDNYGEFPDTTGYTSDNWEQMTATEEDGNLYPFMQKAIGAVIDFTNERFEMADKLGYLNLEKHLHWPKFGGKIFAVTGHVVCMPSSQLVH